MASRIHLNEDVLEAVGSALSREGSMLEMLGYHMCVGYICIETMAEMRQNLIEGKKVRMDLQAGKSAQSL